MRVAYFARRFELALGAAVRATPPRTQPPFRASAPGQLGREAEATAAMEALRAADPGRQTMEAEMAGLVPAALGLFLDGLHEARLDHRVAASVPTHAATEDAGSRVRQGDRRSGRRARDGDAPPRLG